jgi:hypothetical protein
MAWIKVIDKDGQQHLVTEQAFKDLYERHGFTKVQAKPATAKKVVADNKK